MQCSHMAEGATNAAAASAVTPVPTFRPFIAPSEPRPTPCGVAGEGDGLAQLIHLLAGSHEYTGAPSRHAHCIAQRRVRCGTALFLESAPITTVYIVRAGTLKLLKTTQDGYEQVLNFVGAGETVGYDGFWQGCHQTAAIALDEVSVYALSGSELTLLRHQVPAFDKAFERALSRQMVRLCQVAEMMAAVAAEVRLARFLLQLSARMLELGQSPRRLYLRMCRRDLASHLGFAHETVSRSFTTLAELELLRVDNRDVEIVDRAGLAAFAHSTRGVPPGLQRGRERQHAPPARTAAPVAALAAVAVQ